MIFKNVFYVIKTLLFKFILEFQSLRTTEEHKAGFSVTNVYSAHYYTRTPVSNQKHFNTSQYEFRIAF